MNVLVTGEVVFDKGSNPFIDATVYIRVKDVSRIDAESITVAELMMDAVSMNMLAERTVAFAVPGTSVDEKAHYIISVHVDVDNDGRLSKGDFITVQSFPILTHGYPDHVVVRVVQI